MGNLSINNGGVATNKGSMPSIDLRYGPYASVHAAHTALSDDDVVTIGLTVGIIDGSNIVEYWYQGGTAETNLVPKHQSSGSSFSGSYNDLTDKPTFKTVGGQSILGSGDIPVSGGSSSPPPVSHSGATGVIDSLDGGTIHTCPTPLNSLTISALGNNQTVEATILFSTSANWSGLSLPNGVKYAPLKPVIAPEASYVMSIQNGIAVISRITE